MSGNPHITWEIVQQNLDKPWDWYYLSKHPNVTFDIINQNSYLPWDWLGLSHNPFTAEKEAYEEKDSERRCKERAKTIHEELVIKALCPRRLQMHLANGGDIDDF